MSALDSVKAGDDVALLRQTYRRTQELLWIRRVDRVTKTQIIIGSLRFRKSTGAAIPAPRWGQRERLVPATDRLRHREEFRNLVAEVNGMSRRIDSALHSGASGLAASIENLRAYVHAARVLVADAERGGAS